MKIYAILLLVLAAVFFRANTYAASYYVSALNGSDAYPGTQEQPFATIKKGAGLANPGDTVFIMNGTYNSTSGPVLDFHRPGAPQQYITIKAYPGHHPLITASGDVWNAMIIDASYVIVEGLELMGNNTNITYADAYQAYLDYKNGTKGPQAKYNTNGITFGSTTRVDHVTIRNCRVHDFPGAGAGGSQCDYVTIEGNTIYNNAWYMMYAGSGISILNPMHIDTVTGYKLFIRNNICYGNKTTIPWAQINSLSDGNGIIIDVNTGTSTVPAYTGRTLVENNVSYNNGGGGVHAYKAAHVDLINNTAYNNGTVVGYPEIDGTFGSDVKIYNNIMYARSGGACNSNDASATYNYNIYYNGPSYRQGANDMIAADPRFVLPALDGTANFTLKNNSAAINAGSNIPGQYSLTDILGVSRPAGTRPDMGAYEFTGTVAAIDGFTPGNIAALRVGDGTSALSANAAAANVLEYAPNGTPGLMNVVLSNAASTAPNRLLLSGDNTTLEGQLNISSDGRYLSVAGYEAGVGTAASTYKANEKVIARIAFDGTVDYSTRIPAASMNGTVRSAVTGNSSRFYITGTSTAPASGNSTRFQAFGASASTTPTAFFGGLRSLAMFNNQVYYANNNVVGSLTPDPSAGNYGTSITFPGVNASGHNYQGLALLDMNASVSYLSTGYDVLYCADASLGLVKYYWNGTAWIPAGTFNPPSSTGVTGGLYALAARLNELGQPQIFAVKGAASNNEIINITDTSGFNGNINAAPPAVSGIAAAGVNYMFRGVALAPSQLVMTTLPVDLLSFNAYLVAGSVLLDWATAAETNDQEFIVEKSTNGSTFTRIASIPASHIAGGSHYSFTDKSIKSGMAYYRLSPVDKNGASRYSRVVAISMEQSATAQIKLFPNPATALCSVAYPAAGANATLSIFQADGRQAGEYQLKSGSTQRSIDVSALPAGQYFIRYTNGNHIISGAFMKH